MSNRVTAGLLLVGLFLTAVFARDPRETTVEINQRDFLRLQISDALRESTGLWADPLHWRVIVARADLAQQNYGLGDGSKPGILVALDHPNGVDVSKYKSSYTTLVATAESTASGVLERYGWEDDFVVKAVYMRKISGEI